MRVRCDHNTKRYGRATALEALAAGTWLALVLLTPRGPAIAGSQVMQTEPGETEAVRSVAFSPDGSLVASASDSGVIRLRHVATGRLHGQLHATTGLEMLAFSPDGRTLAAAASLLSSASGAEGIIQLWDIARTAVRATLRTPGRAVGAVTFSPDGMIVASGGYDGLIRLWDAGTGDEVTTIAAHPRFIAALQFSRDGSRLASASADHTVKVWDTAASTHRLTPTGHTDWVSAAAFAPDGSALATAGRDGTVRIWNAATGEPAATLAGHDGWVTSVAYAGDGQTLASGGFDGTVRLWDTQTFQQLAVLRGTGAIVRALATSPDGRLLARGGGAVGYLGGAGVQLWDLSTHTLRWRTPSRVRNAALSVSPDGSVIATDGGEGEIWLYDAATLCHLATLPGPSAEVSAVLFSPDGAKLAASWRDGSVRMWDRDALGPSIVLAAAGPRIAFSSDSATLVTGDERGIVRRWDVTSGELHAEARDHEGAVTDVQFNPDGRLLISAGADHTIRLWEPATLAVLATIPGDAAAFGLDTLAIVSRAGRTLTLRHTTTGRQLVAGAEIDAFFAVAASPDGTRLLTYGPSALALWDGQTGELLGRAYSTFGRGYSAGVVAPAFSPDGGVVIYGTIFGPRLWSPPFDPEPLGTPGEGIRSLVVDWARGQMVYGGSGGTLYVVSLPAELWR